MAVKEGWCRDGIKMMEEYVKGSCRSCCQGWSVIHIPNTNYSKAMRISRRDSDLYSGIGLWNTFCNRDLLKKHSRRSLS